MMSKLKREIVKQAQFSNHKYLMRISKLACFSKLYRLNLKTLITKDNQTNCLIQRLLTKKIKIKKKHLSITLREEE
jgi:hypothetical protein